MLSTITNPRQLAGLCSAALLDFNSMWLSCNAIGKYGAIQKPLELYRAIRFLKDMEIRNLVEIGTRRGGSLYAWSRLARPDARIISIDFHSDMDDATARDVLGRIVGRGQTLQCVRQDSHLPETRTHVQELLGGEKIDFLFIDGDHSYEGVRQDWDYYQPMVRAGGVIAFHDIIENDKHPNYGVPRFWREIRGGFSASEFIDPTHPLPGNGIGMLVKA